MVRAPMRARWLAAAIVLLGLAVVPLAIGQELVPVPPLAGRVTDLTSTLRADQIAALDKRLGDFEARKGAQIAVLLVPTTRPETIEQFGIRVAEQWKIGRKNADDGVIVLVAKNDRTLRIEVGYGLEGAVPDLKASRIIREIITPRFRENDFYGGLTAGTQALMNLVEGEDLPAPAAQARSRDGDFGNLNSLFVILLIGATIVGAILTRVMGRFFGSALTGGAAGLVAWLIVGTLVAGIFAGFLVFVFTLARGATGLGTAGSHRGGGWPGGGGWSGGGGGGGGGWSGGGGGFGGGGASGRW
jgi:uncharacterized protein